MKKEELESSILREYVRESLILEYGDPLFRGGVGLNLLQKGVSAATGTGGAIVGRAKKLGASIQHLVRGVLGLTGETLTAGIFTADMDKINREYLEDIKNINTKYGPYIKQVNDKFGKNMSPLFVTTLFLNPPLAIKALGVKKALEGTAQKSLESALESGASEQFKSVVDGYFEKYKEAARKPPKFDQEKLNGRNDSEKKQILSAIQSEKRSEIVRKLKDEKQKLSNLGIPELSLKRYSDLIKDLETNV